MDFKQTFPPVQERIQDFFRSGEVELLPFAKSTPTPVQIDWVLHAYFWNAGSKKPTNGCTSARFPTQDF